MFRNVTDGVGGDWLTVAVAAAVVVVAGVACGSIVLDSSSSVRKKFFKYINLRKNSFLTFDLIR